MPPSGYLTVAGIQSALQTTVAAHPTISQLVTLPERSIENRTIRAVKIGRGSGRDRRGVLLIGGVHARELVNPDALVALTVRLCDAYANGTALTFGGRTYSPAVVALIVENMDVYVLPLVNPDGRSHVQAPRGDPMWRKNRAVNAGSPCRGVDINRNFDFLWNWTIGSTSADPCSDVFHGPSAFSEPETRNVRWMLDTFGHIRGMLDMHSYGRLILHPWGDDDAQTTDPAMNFRNSAYDGLRGIRGDTAYREHITSGDLRWLVRAGENMRDAVTEVAGNVYNVQPSIWLYPTSGTSKDYAYSRHLVNTGVRKVYAYTVETGTQFQPAFPGASVPMDEAQAAAVQFCLNVLCAAEHMAAGRKMTSQLVSLRAFEDELVANDAGRRWVDLLRVHQAEVLQLLADDEGLKKVASDLFGEVAGVVASRDSAKPKRFQKRLVADVEEFAMELEKRASSRLRKALVEVRKTLPTFSGASVRDALSKAGRAAPADRD
jgi:carboxypeptidase T